MPSLPLPPFESKKAAGDPTMLGIVDYAYAVTSRARCYWCSEMISQGKLRLEIRAVTRGPRRLMHADRDCLELLPAAWRLHDIAVVRRFLRRADEVAKAELEEVLHHLTTTPGSTASASSGAR